MHIKPLQPTAKSGAELLVRCLNMKRLNIIKKIFLILFGLYSCFNIMSANVIHSARSNFSIYENALCAFILLISVIYLHIGIQSYLAPLYMLNKKYRKEIALKTLPYISKGLIGLGYFFIISFSLSFLGIGAEIKPPSSVIYIGIFLIGLGVLEKTRAIVIVLFEKMALVENIEQNTPADR